MDFFAYDWIIPILIIGLSFYQWIAQQRKKALDKNPKPQTPQATEESSNEEDWQEFWDVLTGKQNPLEQPSETTPPPAPPVIHPQTPVIPVPPSVTPPASKPVTENIQRLVQLEKQLTHVHRKLQKAQAKANHAERVQADGSFGFENQPYHRRLKTVLRNRHSLRTAILAKELLAGSAGFASLIDSTPLPRLLIIFPRANDDRRTVYRAFKQGEPHPHIPGDFCRR